MIIRVKVKGEKMKKDKIVIIGALVLACIWLSVGILGQTPNPQTTPQNVVITSPPPTGPVTARVATVGVTQQVSYCYWVVAVYPIGMSPAAAPACTSLSNGTLSGSNYNRVSWSKPPGAVPTGYWVVRTTRNTFPGSGTVAVNTLVLASTVFTLNDQSNTLHAFSFKSIPFANGIFSIDNTNNPTPILSLTINGVVVSQWTPMGGLAFSSVGSGSNTSATMVVNTGASLGPAGSGVVNANEVNGGTIPVSAGLVGTDGSRRFQVVPMPAPTTNTYSNYVATNGSGLFQSVPMPPPNTTGITYTATGTLSTNDVNVGTTIINGSTGLSYRIVDFQIQATGGSTAGCTSVNIDDSSSTVGVAIPVADLGTGAVATPSSANLTFTTYAWQGQMPTGHGIMIIKAGGSCTTATAFNYNVRVTTD
jgi:hypothetical protein